METLLLLIFVFGALVVYQSVRPRNRGEDRTESVGRFGVRPKRVFRVRDPADPENKVSFREREE